MGRVKNVPHRNRSLVEPLEGTSQVSAGNTIRVSSSQTQKTIKVIVNKPRYMPSTLARRDIRRHIKSTELVIPAIHFQQAVKQIKKDMNVQVGFSAGALSAMQEALEAFAVDVFTDINLCSTHTRRVTATPRDLALALRLRGRPCQYQ